MLSPCLRLPTLQLSLKTSLLRHHNAQYVDHLGGTLVTQTAAQINGAASTGKAIAMAMVFGG